MRCSAPEVLRGSASPGATAALCLTLLIALASSGCATQVEQAGFSSFIAPLELDGRTLRIEDALAAPPLELLGMSEEMQAFVLDTTTGINSERGRLQALHDAIKDDNGLDMRYDPFADGDARAAFDRRTANCLSYAHLFVALAREAGLDARYQWMEVRPEWQRIGDRVAVRLHVNVNVRMRDGERFMVDIDPLQRSEVAGSRLMSDAEGLALAHNNLAIVALSEDRPDEAWKAVVQGIAAAPGLSQLWVNLGAIYRYTGQDSAAEAAYFQALVVDPTDRSAMNNLVVLYEQIGRQREAERWLSRLHRYRDRNPYYHESLGEAALAGGDLDAAYDHYHEAWRLQPEDGRLAFSLGVIQGRRGKLKAAERHLREAVEKATFTGERQRYLVTLQRLREEQAAL